MLDSMILFQQVIRKLELCWLWHFVSNNKFFNVLAKKIEMEIGEEADMVEDMNVN